MNSKELEILGEDLLIDKTSFKLISHEVTCIICSGLLNNPQQCAKCEAAYCTNCIEKWKSNNHSTCLLKCSNVLELKPPSRLLKNLLDKVLLKCNICKLEVSLLIFPSHHIECKDRNSSKSNCPFCPDCIIPIKDVLKKDLQESPLLKERINLELVKLTDKHKKEQESYVQQIDSLNEMIEVFNKRIDNLEIENENLKSQLSRSLSKKDMVISPNRSENMNRVNSHRESENNRPNIANVMDNYSISEPCQHYPLMNVVKFFECCNKIYNCSKCHDRKEYHLVGNSNGGYCLRCKTPFNIGEFSCGSCRSKFNFEV